MIDKHIATFITVADSGSFLKAAEVLYVSANAVTKQINLLEDRLNVQLFDRSARGVKLTEAGQLIYRESKKLIKQTDKVIQQAQKIQSQNETTIRVGVSSMNPIDLLMNYWPKIIKILPNEGLATVPFEDDLKKFSNILENLGREIDVLLTVAYENSFWKDKYDSIVLQEVPICLAVSKQSALAYKKEVTPEDLTSLEILFSTRGLIADMDRMRDDLAEHYPNLTLRSMNHDGYEAFNEIAANPEICLITTAMWAKSHPLVTAVPVSWKYTIPYGIAFSKNPSEKVRQFIDALQHSMSEKD